MPRFKYPHDKVIDYLSLALSLVLIMASYELAMTFLRIYNRSVNATTYEATAQPCENSEVSSATSGGKINVR